MAVSFSASAHAAEEPPLITDRPDQTESAYTVPAGLFQIEGGWGYGRSREPDSEVIFQGFPQALLRIGLSPVFELRLQLPGIDIEKTDTRTGETSESGLVDAALGFKVVIAEEKGARPQTAFLGTLAVPTGDEEFTSDRVDPAFRFVFSNTLSDKLSLGYNLGMAWLTDADEEGVLDTASFFDWTVALGIGFTAKTGPSSKPLDSYL